MPAEPDLVRRNFETLAEHEADLCYRVYEGLFDAHPELVDLFTARRSAANSQMVRETLMYAIDHLNGATWVAINMSALGAKHVEYEVTEEMYGWVIDAMLSAMADISGPEWSEALSESWQELLWHLADLMIAELPKVSSVEFTRQAAAAS